MTKNLSFKSIYRILLLLIVSLLILGQLQRIQITSSIAVYLHEVVMGMLVFISGLRFFQHKKISHFRESVNPGQWIWLALPLIYITTQTIILNSYILHLISLLYLGRWFLYLGFFLALWWGKKQKFFSHSELSQIILSIGGGIAILGIIQYLIWPDTRGLYNFGWDDHYYRLISTLFDPGFTVLIIAFSALFYLGTRKNTQLSALQRFLIIPFFFITILLTYSRAGYLAFVTGLVTLFATTKKYPYILYSIFFILAIPFLPRSDGEGVKLERVASIESRVESNQQALQQLTPISLIFGQGMYRENSKYQIPDTNYQLPSHAKAPDNSFVFLLTSFGIVGVLTLVPLAWKMLHMASKQPWLLAILLSWGVHSMFNLSLVYPWAVVMVMMFFVYTGDKNEVIQSKRKV